MADVFHSAPGPIGLTGDTGAQGPPGTTVNPRGLWLIGSTYAQFDGVTTSAGAMYVSLVSGNTGHTPASSPTFWLAVVSNYPSLNAAGFVFSQTPGGSLTGGAGATVTLSPVPLGVNGADTNHFLYISGGTGTAEAVLITGGTAVSGGSSGTVTFTPVNSHSGAWTVQSATAGVQEAYWSNGGAGNLVIQIPSGAYTFRAPCRIAAAGVWVIGAGPTGTVITNSVLNGEAFQFSGGGSQGNGLVGLQIIGNASSTTGYAIEAINQTYFHVRDLYLLNWASGMLLNGTITAAVRDVWIRNLVNDGVKIQGSATNDLLLDGVETVSSTAYASGIHIVECGEVTASDCSFIGANDGGLINPAAGQSVASVEFVNVFFDHGVVGLHINPAATGSVVRTRCAHCWACSVTGVGGVWLDSSGGGSIGGFIFSNGDASSNNGSGLRIDTGSTAGISGCTIANNTGTGIDLGDGAANASSVTITGNRIGNNLGGWGVGTQQFGIYAVTTGANIVIVGNEFLGNTVTPIVTSATITAFVLRSNVGIDDAAAATVASSATIGTIGVFPIYYISGTTTTTTLIGATWRGRTLTLIKTDAGSLTVGGGGNIPGAHALNQNQSITLQFDGVNWY